MKRNLLQRAALVLTLVCLAALAGFPGSRLLAPATTQATSVPHSFPGDGLTTGSSMANGSSLHSVAAAHAAAPALATTIYQRDAIVMTRVGTTSWFTDSTATGGAAIKAWTSGSGVSDTVIVPSSGSYTFSFVGREDYYGAGTNTHAHVSLYLDGSSTPAAGVFVTNASGWVSYSLSTTLSAGTHTFALLFDNDAYGGSPSTDRNAYFDVVTISGGTGATPTNTATPVPSASATKTATASSTATNSATPMPTATRTPTPLTPTATNTPTQGHAIQTVFLIVLENENWSSIKGSSSAPYINNTLLPRASYADHYYTPPGNHPSLPNYLWLEAGTNFGITNDNSPATNHQSTTKHLTTLLSAAGISWKDYQENISGTSCPLSDSYPYAVRHNPMVYFDDQTNSQSTTSATCIAHVRPYSELAGNLQSGSVARYNFIMPNVCDDGHDSCAPLNNPILQADTWLSTAVPIILNSSAYKNGGALFITWDEGGNASNGPIGMVVLSPDAKGSGYNDGNYYTHSSTLRTIEEIFGVSPLLGDAANATDLRDLFLTFP